MVGLCEGGNELPGSLKSKVAETVPNPFLEPLQRVLIRVSLNLIVHWALKLYTTEETPCAPAEKRMIDNSGTSILTVRSPRFKMANSRIANWNWALLFPPPLCNHCIDSNAELAV
ncbi:hypothetical protein ANN_23155 [Periplaneta americana]|uniref:Uncharacterized protein n=1 Tax=Periplaneta americana TaxID=6978 RepID=A0ABQ8SKA8_PERAM|nr:hypothetical protein ANN_23155 [Periplaneta americana]